MPHFRKLLRNRNFVLYSVGQAFSQFGDRLVQIVLIGFVYKRWPGSTFQLAKLLCFTLLPAFVISPIAGVYIDRWNKKYVMVVSDMFRAAAILCIPVFFVYRASVVPVYIILFLTFTAACFFLPTRLSVIPSLVSKEDILLANSASTITWVISGIAGFSFGGLLAEWIGVERSLYLNSAVYFLSAASFFFVLYSSRAAAPAEKTFFHDFRTGLKTLFSNKKMKFVMFSFFVVSSMIGACYVVLVVFIQETLHTMTKYVGLFSMCVFIGVFAGSLIYGKTGHRVSREKTVFLSIFLTGISMDIFVAGLRMTGSVPFGGIAAFLVGLFLSPAYVTANTIVHETIDRNLRGRIFSSLAVIMNFGFLLFMFLASFLAEHIDRLWILVACASGFAVFGLVGLVSFPTGYLREINSSS